MLQSYPSQSASRVLNTTLALVSILAGAIVVGIAIFPMVAHNYPIAHSTQFNLSWVFQYQRQFFSGQFYPRWLEFSNFGFGNATFVFYPPMCMVATLPFRALGLSMPASLIASTGLAIAVLGLGLYFYGRYFFPTWIALGISVLGMLSPYFLLDIYHRGSLGEVWAIAFLPWILWATQQVIDRSDRLKPLLFLALTYGLLELSHVPTLLLFTLLWWSMPWFMSDRQLMFKAAGRCYAGILLSFGWTAFFLIPVLLDQRLIQVASLTESPEYQAQNRLMLDGILSLHPKLPTHWFETGSGLIPFWWFTIGFFSLGAIAYVADVFGKGAVPASVSLDSEPSLSAVEPADSHKLSHKLNKAVFFWLLASGLALLMMTDILGWIYAISPIMQRIQFSWRWFSVTAIPIPMLCGYVCLKLQDSAPTKASVVQKIVRAIVAVGAIALLAGSLWLSNDVLKRAYFDSNTINRFAELAEQKQFPFEPDTSSPGEPILFNWHWIYPQGLALGDVPEYRAKGVMMPLPPDKRNYPIVLLDIGDASRIKIPHWNFGYRQLFLDSPNGDNPYKLELRTFYYPGWRVEIDGETVPTQANELGQIVVYVQPGKHEVDVTYVGTWAEWLGYSVTALTVGGLLWQLWRKSRDLDREPAPLESA